CCGARRRDQSRRRRASIVRRSTIDPVPCRRDAAPFPSSLGTRMKPAAAKTAWALLALIGAFCLGTVALRRGESINALRVVRATPAVVHNDGLDYVPTNKHVLFGHHFAAIAGAGPLVGPVLAAQMGYLPGTLWLIVGVVLAGAVQDFMVLVVSSRRDGRSLGD